MVLEKFAASANLREQPQPWQLQLSDNLQLTVQTGADIELRASAGTATLQAPDGTSADNEPLKLVWQPVIWRRTAGGANTLQSTGTVTGIQPAWVDILLAKKAGDGPIEGAGMRTDLSLSGDWDIRMADNLNVRARIQRQRGDLWLVEPEIAAGIRAFDLQVQSVGEDVNLAVNWDTESAGIITARVGHADAAAGGWMEPAGQCAAFGNRAGQRAEPDHLGVSRAARLAHLAARWTRTCDWVARCRRRSSMAASRARA